MAGVNMMSGPPASSMSSVPASSESRHHQRSKSSVLRSLIGGGGHKRNNSDGSGLPAAPVIPPIATTPDFHVSQHSLAPSRSSGIFHVGFDAAAAAAMEPERYAYALGELQQNRQERSPEQRRGRDRDEEAPPSPTKSAFSTISLRPFGRDRDSSKPPKTKDNRNSSPTKPKKAKSATNLVALLRPRSAKNLKGMLADEADAAQGRDKENRSPPDSLGGDHHASVVPPPPIYAQFASQCQYFGPPSPRIETPAGGSFVNDWSGAPPPSLKSPRPKSFQAYVTRQGEDPRRSAESASSDSRAKRMTWGRDNTPAAGAAAVAASGRPPLGSRTKSSTAAAGAAPELPFIDPKDIDKHLEAMLDRRNIPENQRYKMRNLSDTIKMEFIRQDWAEMQAKRERPASHDGSQPAAAAGTPGQPQEDKAANANASPTKKEKKKHGRGLSLTIVRGGGGGNKSNPSSPTKKKAGDSSSSLGRHFRSRSSDSLVNEPPSPGMTVAAGGGGGGGAAAFGAGLLAKVKGQQIPGDFVAYLQRVRQPELVEVGKLHKLRLLLRNETVAWTDEFVRLGGMKEIVDLLHRIMGVEWREEHEDALLHETLLCLKALCTTGLALQYLHSIHTTLFPALLHMIFDPEKKGPSEFTTRNIITSILLTYIEAAAPQERISRAHTVLGYLRDPEPKEEDRPVDFVLEMRRERPYRVWCKEVVNVTKEVFWIFLHNLNIVALPSVAADGDDRNRNSNNQSKVPSSTGQTGPQNSDPSADAGTTVTTPGANPPPHPLSTPAPDPSDTQQAYMSRHFPQPRPPVPAAPYVGGVEWDATNYLASHLDLLNAIVACTGPSAAERNALRAALRLSGWERCLGGSLRLCKEKFYGAVHDGLRTWVAAAHEDGWDVRDVRYGPPPPSSPSKSKSSESGASGSGPASAVKGAEGGAGGNKRNNSPGKKKAPPPPPRIEMPKLDFSVGIGVGVGVDVGVGVGPMRSSSGVTISR